MSAPEFASDDGGSLLEEDLLEGDFFDGPGEEPWSPLVPGEGPDGWDASDAWPGFSPGAQGAEATAGERLRGSPGERVADGGFGPGSPGDLMPAGAALHALVQDAVTGGLAGMADDAVVGVVAAARRLRSHAEMLEVRATREFAHRRWESSTGPERDKNGRWLFKGRDAEFAADELAFELVESPLAVQERMDLSLALRDRLPEMDALLGNGVDLYRCRIVHEVTEVLSDEHARQVDALLAPEAAGLRYAALRRRARKLAMMLDPDSDRERRERATRKKARVEAFPERSGNYAIAGRELPLEEVLASRAHIRAVALELRAGGVRGSLRELDIMVFLDLTQGRDPRDRVPATSAASEPGAHVGADGDAGPCASPDSEDRAGPREDPADARGAATGSPQDTCVSRGEASWRRGNADAASRGHDDGDEGARAAGTGEPDNRDWRDTADLAAACLAAYDDDDAGADGANNDDARVGSDNEDTGGGGTGSGQRGGPWPFSPPGPGKPGGRAPFPAKINLLVPIGTLLGWSDMPGEAGRDVIDPHVLRDLVQASSHHPATRWCVTLVDADGTAAAHGCARGQHPWTPPPGTGRTRDGTDRDARTTGGDADAGRADPRTLRERDRTPAPAQLEQFGQLMDGLDAAVEPIAKGSCDHRHREDSYRPGRVLQHLVRARNATCPAPGCEAASTHSDLDHTRAWPDGDTDECNMGPPCRHDHRLKQAPGWDLTQPRPGFFRWKAPSGRVYQTGPTKYDV